MGAPVGGLLVSQIGMRERAFLLKVLCPQRRRIRVGSAKGNIRRSIGRRGQHEAVVVVHVFAQQIHAAGRPGDSLAIACRIACDRHPPRAGTYPRPSSPSDRIVIALLRLGLPLMSSHAPGPRGVSVFLVHQFASLWRLRSQLSVPGVKRRSSSCSKPPRKAHRGLFPSLRVVPSTVSAVVARRSSRSPAACLSCISIEDQSLRDPRQVAHQRK